MTEDRGRKTEGGGRKADDGGRKTEDGRRRATVACAVLGGLSRIESAREQGLICGQPNIALWTVAQDGKPPPRAVCANRISMICTSKRERLQILCGIYKRPQAKI